MYKMSSSNSGDTPSGNTPPSSPPSSPGGSNNGSSNNPVPVPVPVPTIVPLSLPTAFDASYQIFDISYSITTNSVVTRDVSWNPADVDCSENTIFIPPIVDFSLNTISIGTGFNVINQQGWSADGSNVTLTDFLMTDLSLDTQITQHLGQVVTTYNDAIVDSSVNAVFLQIQGYAADIQCSDFHGKGSIDDYENLFLAASKIANESKQMQLDIDVEGFTEFGKAADDLSELFNGFIMKLKNVNIINDYNFLTSIAAALKKIVNLSNVFGRFKETILATTSVHIPKSAHDTAVLITGVMGEINCAMQYIGHFVDASSNNPVDCQLSETEQNVINQAVNTINSWNILCEQGISVSLQHDPAIQVISQVNRELIEKKNALVSATSALKTKLAKFNFC